MIDKKVLTRTFSRIACRYDSCASVQNRVAARLAAMIIDSQPRSILEIGCGTGNFTRELLKRFPAAWLVGVDISPDMIDIARQKTAASSTVFTVADAEALHFRKRFDLIASNAAFQWFSDLSGTMRRFKNLLTRDGALYFSTFGPQTFCELRESLRLFDGRKHVVAEQFLDKTEVQKILCDRFAKSVIKERRLTVTFASLRELFEHIKYTSGVTGGVKKIWTPQALRLLERIYKQKFKRIAATYQVFLCQAR